MLRSGRVDYRSAEYVDITTRFKAGETAEQIMGNTSHHPAIVNAVLRDYERNTGTFSMTVDSLQRIQALPIEGDFPIRDAWHLAEIIERLCWELERRKQCFECGKREACVCLRCAAEMCEEPEIKDFELPKVETAEEANA